MSELLKHFELTRGDIFRDIEGVSKEQFDMVPESLPNSLHWQLGHVLVAAEMDFLVMDQDHLLGQRMCRVLKHLLMN